MTPLKVGMGLSTVAVAGWLFADSMLGLTIAGLASDSGTPAPPKTSPAASPTPTPTARPTPRPKPRVKARTVGVERRPLVVTFKQNDTADQRIVRARYKALLAHHRKAAFVLTFGNAVAPDDGVALASHANAQLRQAAPEIFAGSGQRSFWQGVGAGDAAGEVRVELYLFTQS